MPMAENSTQFCNNKREKEKVSQVSAKVVLFLKQFARAYTIVPAMHPSLSNYVLN